MLNWPNLNEHYLSHSFIQPVTVGHPDTVLSESMSACYVASVVWLFATLWIVTHQAPVSKGFSRQKYWSGLPRPPPGELPDPGIEHMSSAAPALQADSLPQSHGGSPPFWIPEGKQDQIPVLMAPAIQGGKSLQKKLHRDSQQIQPLVAYKAPEGGLGGWCFIITLPNIHAET